jgi:3-hydroxyisobutyrate dehydrogenase-like beta-hydroxyacid dehydrogenase
MFVHRAPMMAERYYPNASSTLSSFTVYLDLIDAALKGSEVNAPLARAAVDLYRRAIAAGMGEQELSCIYELTFPRAAQERSLRAERS